MKTKIQYALDNFKNIEDSLMCPLCNEDLFLDKQSLKCKLNHTFNINKKGIVSFANPLIDRVYNTPLFGARRRVLESNLYEPIMNELKSILEGSSSGFVVDAGCGEGSYMNYLSKHSSHKFLGVDLSKDGLNIASDNNTANLFLADLSNLPLKDESVDFLLNILSPANYKEFSRILKSDSYFIKIILEENYLKELRDELSLSKADNSDVLSLLEEHMLIVDNRRITYTKEIDSNLSDDIFLMTPMSQYKDLNKKLTEITIDLRILICKKRSVDL